MLHCKNLQLHLRLGLKKKIYHVLQFDESKWLKPYIKFNTQKRVKAKKVDDKDGKHFTNQ